MHLSHIDEDLEAWYLNFDFRERVDTAFRPNLDGARRARRRCRRGRSDVSDARGASHSDFRASGRIGHSAVDPDDVAPRRRTSSAPTAPCYPKGTAIPIRADFNTLDNPFAWSSADRTRSQTTPAAGVHFVVFNPSSDDFQRNRLAMDGVLPGRQDPVPAARARPGLQLGAARRRTARTSSCRRGGTARSRSPSCTRERARGASRSASRPSSPARCCSALELAASRVLAPCFGNSLFVWGALIGVVLAGLSIGYWAGGALADRLPSPRLLVGCVLLGGAARARGPARRRAACSTSSCGWDPGPRARPARRVDRSSSAPPSVVLAAVTPIAVRLARARARRASARPPAACSRSRPPGASPGTFATAFWLIPELGIDQLLAVGAAALLRSRRCRSRSPTGVALAASPRAALAARRGRRRASSLAPETGGSSSPRRRSQLLAALPLARGPAAQRAGADRSAGFKVALPQRHALPPPARRRDDGRPLPALRQLVPERDVRSRRRTATRLRLHRLLPARRSAYRPVGATTCSSSASAAARRRSGSQRDFPELRLQVGRARPGRRRRRAQVLPRAARSIPVDGRGRPPLPRAHDERCDVIAIDAYYADAIPFHLTTREFLETRARAARARRRRRRERDRRRARRRLEAPPLVLPHLPRGLPDRRRCTRSTRRGDDAFDDREPDPRRDRRRGARGGGARGALARRARAHPRRRPRPRDPRPRRRASRRRRADADRRLRADRRAADGVGGSTRRRPPPFGRGVRPRLHVSFRRAPFRSALRRPAGTAAARAPRRRTRRRGPPGRASSRAAAAASPARAARQRPRCGRGDERGSPRRRRPTAPSSRRGSRTPRARRRSPTAVLGTTRAQPRAPRPARRRSRRAAAGRAPDQRDRAVDEVAEPVGQLVRARRDQPLDGSRRRRRAARRGAATSARRRRRTLDERRRVDAVAARLDDLAARRPSGSRGRRSRVGSGCPADEQDRRPVDGVEADDALADRRGSARRSRATSARYAVVVASRSRAR